jgi:hypothetical protein
MRIGCNGSLQRGKSISKYFRRESFKDTGWSPRPCLIRRRETKKTVRRHARKRNKKGGICSVPWPYIPPALWRNAAIFGAFTIFDIGQLFGSGSIAKLDIYWQFRKKNLEMVILVCFCMHSMLHAFSAQSTLREKSLVQRAIPGYLSFVITSRLETTQTQTRHIWSYLLVYRFYLVNRLWLTIWYCQDHRCSCNTCWLLLSKPLKKT